MEARLTVDDLARLFGTEDDPDDGERQEPPQEPLQRVEPVTRPDRWAWLRIAPEVARRAA